MEYLAPGVYVQEASSGNTPIAGVSTSTALMIGVTQRGPVNKPTLITSFSEFNRVFGSMLDHRTFTEGRSALPHALQGFFNNGGLRVYVYRIIGPSATFAETDVFAEPIERHFATEKVGRIDRAASSLLRGGHLVASGTRASILKQIPILRVHARYQGLWGNQLKTLARPVSLLNTTVAKDTAVGDTVVLLHAVLGLSAGSYVHFSSAGAGLTTHCVNSVNSATNEVTFATPLAVSIPTAATAASVEYDLIIERLENEKVVESEVFEYLGLQPSHARYGPKIVGTFNRDSLLASDSGESQLVRLSDLTLASHGTPLADEGTLNRMSQLSSATARQLTNGMDDLDHIDDSTYIAAFLGDLGSRTGVQRTENEEIVSMVAAPGRTSIMVQKALIEHCEKTGHRFAVIETPRESNVEEAVTHRQNFDTPAAAIYYPWLVVPDPFGAEGELLSIPPSGHAMGIYARTDATRGVWAAPANEVVQGVLQLETAITTGEQDILNPLGINVLRDFRTANRGIRIWGSRTLSSDPEWKYINVRRLFLFLKQSLDHGLQFAVFEPNTANLWTSVKQSITNFLTMVWRNGGLKGAKQEEAFFVNVGYNVTMTQTDIANGRLIVEIGFAPVKPAEFVIIRITQKTREATT